MSFPLSFNRRDYLTETWALEDEMKMSESNVILIALGLGGSAAASAVPLLRRHPPWPLWPLWPPRVIGTARRPWLVWTWYQGRSSTSGLI